ncbi:MAG: hypothetical protein QNJ94_07300 [Alphaproteobacteria bacterium]|nr:hypothetical protein [Alphaproteobacteria bacterium]
MTSTQSARIVALWIMHGMACAKLLREHGRRDHASNFETALDELRDILADQVGRDELSRALDWATSELWDDQPALVSSDLTH